VKKKKEAIDNSQVEQREKWDNVPVHLAQELRSAFSVELGALRGIVAAKVRFLQGFARFLAGFRYNE